MAEEIESAYEQEGNRDGCGERQGGRVRCLLPELMLAIREDEYPVSDAELAAYVLELQVVSEAFGCHVRGAMVRLDGCGYCQGEGFRSVGAFVEAHVNTPRARTNEQVRIGKALRRLPGVEAAARNGELSVEHCRKLAECAALAIVETAVRDQQLLVERARELPIRQFRVAVNSWLAHANPNDDGKADPASDPDTSELHVSETIDGIWMLSGKLSAEDGQLIATALDAEVDRRLRARRDGDPTNEGLKTSTIRAKALADLIANTMRREPSDASVPDRYRVGLIFTAEDLARFANHPACCDSPLYQVVLNSKGEVLDIGRTAKEWPTGIRRAITLRDRGCRFPGCDRPPSWTDIHHCHEWDHGGPTCMNNGILLCRAHHTFVHTNHWTITINDNRPTFRKPNGTIHQPGRHQLTL